MEVDAGGYSEVANGSTGSKNAAVSCPEKSCQMPACSSSSYSMGPVVKQRTRKSPRKNYRPVKIARAELEVDTNGYETDESDDYSINTIAPEQGLPPLTQPSEERMQCEQEASQMVHDANLVLGDRAIKNPKLNDLIASLTSLMLQIKSLAKGDLNSMGYSSLNESIADLRKKIDPSNLKCFQDNVEVHFAHIQSGMSQMGNLHAFSERHVTF